MRHIGQLQAARNAETRDSWSRFTEHRERVTRMLLDGASATKGKPAGKLCVLGAGNCNDLDLNRLADAFSHVELVDLDDEAIAAGLTRQGIATQRVTARGCVDVTGVANLLSAWAPDLPASDEQVDTCIASSRRAGLPLTAGDYSVAMSVCLLSQLIESVTLTLGADHPRFLDLLKCIRREHVRQLIDLAMPGGTVILITDVVSSLTVPELETVTESELPTLVGRAIAQHNFFTGMNPFVIKQMLETDVSFATRLAGVQLSNPWVWDLGPRRYAVCALTAQRTSGRTLRNPDPS